VMLQPLLQNSLHEKRRNMSKRSFDLVTDSNASRMASDAHFKGFESPMRNARAPFELLRMRSNALERIGEALHA
ncbi:MAG: hypothetical protein WBV90_03110, partial [Terrimicrobiaceae bacterium]